MDTELRSMRYELKMECEGISLPQAQAWARLHSAGFREAYPPRQVNSLYFDTFGLDSYNDHIEGVPERRKLRFRWYGEDLGRACGQMELKNKRERAGWKQVQPVDAVLDLRSCDWMEIQQAMLAGLHGDDSRLFPELLHVSRPLVINSYWREYYICADERVRLTLDYRQQVYDQWLIARPNLTFPRPTTDLIILELKCEVAHARYLADVLAEFPLRVNRHSKYISAVDGFTER